MTIPSIPDIPNMTADKLVMWIAAALLVFVLWGVNSKLEAMMGEHIGLLRVAIIQCYNHAENNPDPAMRQNQQRRCLTFQLNTSIPKE
jgi:hypothetical protein